MIFLKRPFITHINIELEVLNLDTKIEDEIREKTILSLLKDGMLTVVEAEKCLSITEEELKIRVNAV